MVHRTIITFMFFFWYRPATTIAPIAEVRDAIRLTRDQEPVEKPRSVQTGFMYSAKQLFRTAVGMKDMMNAATRMPQPLNCFFSIKSSLLELCTFYERRY
jgi:hypothetical protein